MRAIDSDLFDPANPDRPRLDFLSAVWGGGPHSLCWGKPGRKPGDPLPFIICHSPEEMIEYSKALLDCDVWFGAHPLKAVPSHGGRGKVEDVARVVAIPADMDWAHPTHKQTTTPLPSEVELRRALRLLGDLYPSVVINSGHGLQPWWILGHPISPDEAEDLIARFDVMFARLGLKNERNELASIMRLPGTINYKGDSVTVGFES